MVNKFVWVNWSVEFKIRKKPDKIMKKNLYVIFFYIKDRHISYVT